MITIESMVSAIVWGAMQDAVGSCRAHNGKKHVSQEAAIVSRS